MKYLFDGGFDQQEGVDLVSSDTGVSRRSLLKTMAAVPAALAVGGAQAQRGMSEGPTLAIVSRHLQFTDWQGGLEAAIEAGYPGIVIKCADSMKNCSLNSKNVLKQI